MKKHLLALTALSLSIAVSACSHDGGYNSSNPQQSDSQRGWDHKEHMNMMAEDWFRTMDKNGDGVVTWQEYSSYTRKWFKEADVNHDGKLTLEEVKAQFKKEKEKLKSSHRMHPANRNDSNTDDQTNQYNNQ